eukprot:2544043-Pyramimonas_sp.AAC.1
MSSDQGWPIRWVEKKYAYYTTYTLLYNLLHSHLTRDITGGPRAGGGRREAPPEGPPAEGRVAL